MLTNQKHIQPLLVMFGGALLCWILLIIMFSQLGFNVLVSDALWYWNDALDLWSVLNIAHVPGYPIVLRLLNSVLPFVSPTILMQGVALGFWFASIWVCYQILTVYQIQFASWGALFFGVFPFVGVFYVAHPLAQSMASLFLLLTLLAYLQDKPWQFVVFMACGILVHKALWLFFALMLLVAVYKKWLSWWKSLLVPIPFMLYWLYGLTLYGDFLWLLRYRFDEAASERLFLLYDGFLGALIAILNGSYANAAKLVLLLTIYCLAAFLLFHMIKQRKFMLVSLILPVLVYGALLNDFEIFAMVRFATFLAVPLWLFLDSVEWQFKVVSLEVLAYALPLIGAVSQFGFAYYAISVFFS